VVTPLPYFNMSLGLEFLSCVGPLYLAAVFHFVDGIWCSAWLTLEKSIIGVERDPLKIMSPFKAIHALHTFVHKACVRSNVVICISPW